jgi:two-component system nitrate/nitrite response regulator NarL
MNCRIFIVADVRLYREGLQGTLGSTEGMVVVGSCSSLQLGLHLLTLSPDVVLCDMRMSDSAKKLRALTQLLRGRECRIIALGTTEDEAEIVACAEAGVAGLLHSDASLEELIATIDSAMLGELRCRPRAMAAIARRVAALAANPSGVAKPVGLTAREIEVGVLINRGLANKEIADHLGIEVTIVKNHIHSLLHKLQARRRGEAAAHLRQLGVLPEIANRAR